MLRPVRRFASLPWFYPAGVSVLVVLPLLVLTGWTASNRWPAIVPRGDSAVTEIDIHHALQLTQQTGPYSRYKFRHPGPMVFYTLAPLYWLSGYSYAGLCLGTALLNLAAIVTILMVVYRLTGRMGLLWAALLLMLYLRVLGTYVLFYSWNPLIIVLLCALAVVLLAAVAAGRVWYLPAALLVSSFVVQTHLGCTLAVASAAAFSLLLGGSSAVRKFLGISTARTGSMPKALCVAAVLLTLAWLPPVIEQLTQSPGNMSKVLMFLGEHGSHRGWMESCQLLAPMLTAFPATRLGDAVRAGAAVSIWRSPWLVVDTVICGQQFVLVAASYAVARRMGQNFAAVLCLLYFVLVAASVVSVQRIIGPVYLYLMLWMAGLGLLSYAAIGAAWFPVLRMVLRVPQRAVLRGAAFGTAVAALVAGCTFNAVEVWLVAGHFAAKSVKDPMDIARLETAARVVLPTDDDYPCLMRIVDHEAWPIAAGLVARLTTAGYSVVCDPQWNFMFGPQHVVRTPIAGILLICDKETGWPLRRQAGLELIAETDEVLLYWYPRQEFSRVRSPPGRFQQVQWRAESDILPPDSMGLTVRSGPAAPPVRTISVGQSCEAGSAPCRVSLADGQVVYLNANTVIVYDDHRELSVRRGEIYIEMNKTSHDRQDIDSAGRPWSGDIGPARGFVVNTPGREIVARDATFDVRVQGEATHVLTINGDVHVDDVSVLIGRQLRCQGRRRNESPVVSDIAWDARSVAWLSGFTVDQYARVSDDPRWLPDVPGQRTCEHRDWMFLFESAGDREPNAVDAQIEIVETVLKSAGPDDNFMVITAGTSVEALAGRWQVVQPENMSRAVEFLKRTHLIGALDLEQALAAIKPHVQTAGNPVLVHLGTGRPVLGQRDVPTLVERIPDRVRYVGIGVGDRWDPAFMKAAAAATGGCAVRISLDRELRWHTMKCLAALVAPRLRDVRVADRSDKLVAQNKVDSPSLRALRNDYARLFDQYRAVTSIVRGLRIGLRRYFAACVILAADRWRQVDPDPTAACMAAARTLADLGALELAWEYVTTPMAAEPVDASSLMEMARTFRHENRIELADRVYALAFEVRPGDAEILWDRAQTLLAGGYVVEAQLLFRRIARDPWEPRFRELQQRAEQLLRKL